MPQKATAVVASLLLILSATVPAAAIGIGGYQLGGEDARDLTQVTGGSYGNPSFVVSIANTTTSADALTNWANASEQRTVLALDKASNTATIRAPSWSVTSGGRFAALRSLDDFSLASLSAEPISEESFITSVQPNWVHSITRPQRLAQSDFAPRTGWTALDDPAFPTDGISFSDEANKTKPTEWRQAIEADGISADGAEIDIGVIDSGGNVLDGQLIGNGSANSTLRLDPDSKSFISGETVAANGTDAIADENGHGSWTMNALAGNASGTVYDAPAKKANLLVLKALSADGSGSSSDIAQAIRYAADQDVEVLSLSLGSPIADAAIADAIRYAYDEGVKAIVVAAGNTRAFSPGIGSPADVPPVIAVGATNGTTSNASAASAYFSQYSGPQVADGNATNREQVDVVAPGQQTTVRMATADGYLVNKTLSGTSMATPIVASGIAEALSANRTLRQMSHRELHDAITASARPVPNMAVAEAGHGMFSVENLIHGMHPEMSQREAMDSAAEQRQAFYEGLATGPGLVARIAGAAS